MGVEGTSSLPKVGLVLTSDVRHQPDLLVGADNREIRLVMEVVEVVEVVCCTELRLMSPIYQTGAEQSERAESPTFHLTQPVRSVTVVSCRSGNNEQDNEDHL